MTSISAVWLDLKDYGTVLKKQFQIHKRIQNGEGETILGVEHPKTITFGKRGGVIQKKTTIPVFQIDRGGLATAHEPGQLTIYPLISLEQRRIRIRDWVCLLEQSVIDWLKQYNIDGSRSKNPGIWVGEKKVCSLGIQVKKGISLHGLALNIKNSLDTFQYIEACGMPNRPMCTIQDLMEEPPSCKEAFESISSYLIDHLENI